jgi:nuclease-like protein/UvrD-like helicase family protein/schlafen family protein
MARLIPSFMDDRTPPGERDVFNMLAAGPDDWVALHSLELAPWNSGLRTEIDFVVIVPDTGLLCVEVKSHEMISFENDRWNPPEIKRSPFKQAADGRYTFYRRLRELAPQFRNLPVVHCCIFPKARFDLPPNLSVQPWELVDGRAFRGFARGDDFCADLRARMRSAIQADDNLQPLARRLSLSQIDCIVSCCLPVQKHQPGAREQIRQRELEMERVLCDQQKPVLQLVALNDRLIVGGGAGTGKTLIAMEVARRIAEQGRRVALLCFNQLIGDWMRRQIGKNNPLLPNLIVGRAIRIMAEMTGVRIPEDPASEYWENELPDQLEERLTDPDFKAAAAFDYLVIDEAQDLLARPRLWECVTRFLERGIGGGSFCLFGDFDNQVLGERRAMDESLAIIKTTARVAAYRLSENCRNYRIIGDSAVRLSGFEKPVYSGYMRRGGGTQNYDIFFYGREREQWDKLAQWLGEFRAQGYRPSEITILSFRTSDECAATQLVMEGFKLRPAWQQPSKSTGYTSVQAFKGLENKVIILTDVVLGEPAFHRHLFYTGMTRASESVRILCDRNSQKTLTGWFTGKVNG